jgi:hypothetical protein
MNKVLTILNSEPVNSAVPATTTSATAMSAVSERGLHLVAPDPGSARIGVTAHAARAGCRLVCDCLSPGGWMLLDATDDARVHSAATLNQIETWLNE